MEKHQTLLPYHHPFLYSPLSPFASPGEFRGSLLCWQDPDAPEKWKNPGVHMNRCCFLQFRNKTGPKVSQGRDSAF